MDHGTEDLDKTVAMVHHAAVSDVEGTASEDEEVCVTQNVRERALTGALNITQRQTTGVVGSPLPRPTTQRSIVDSDEHQVVVPRSQRDVTEVGRFHHQGHTSTGPSILGATRQQNNRNSQRLKADHVNLATGYANNSRHNIYVALDQITWSAFTLTENEKRTNFRTNVSKFCYKNI